MEKEKISEVEKIEIELPHEVFEEELEDTVYVTFHTKKGEIDKFFNVRHIDKIKILHSGKTLINPYLGLVIIKPDKQLTCTIKKDGDYSEIVCEQK